VVGFVCGAGPASQPAFGQGAIAAAVQEAEAAVTKIVSHSGVRDYAVCNLSAALWGGYDAVVRVQGGATGDSASRRFSVIKGRFTAAAEKEGPSQLASLESKGRVTLTSADDAFARGVPFFVSDVSMTSPTEIACTVTSNPQVKMPRVAARVEWIGEGIRSQVVDTPNAFSSADTPLKKTFRLNSPLDPKDTSLLSIVDLRRGMESGNPCLVSNHVDLTPFATPAGPQR
jgi:hypothetical protein